MYVDSQTDFFPDEMSYERGKEEDEKIRFLQHFTGSRNCNPNQTHKLTPSSSRLNALPIKRTSYCFEVFCIS